MPSLAFLPLNSKRRAIGIPRHFFSCQWVLIVLRIITSDFILNSLFSFANVFVTGKYVDLTDAIED